jgi:hypothetical protein
MTYQEHVSQWEATVSSHLPQLSKPQVAVLACWSYALVVLKSVGMTQVSVWLAWLQGGKVDAWRQKLREWCYDACDKKGDQRAELEVASCFAPLVRWLLSWWEPHEQRLVLVLDGSCVGKPLDGAEYQCGLPGHGYPSGVASARGRDSGSMGAMVGGVAGSVGPSGAVALAGAGDGR